MDFVKNCTNLVLLRLKGGGWLSSRFSCFMPKEDLVPTVRVQGTGWALGLIWRGTENLASIGIQSPDHPACSESPYWLCYLCHQIKVIQPQIILIKEDLFSLQHFGRIQHFKIKVQNILNIHYILEYTGSHTTKLHERIYILHVITAMLGGILVE